MQIVGVIDLRDGLAVHARGGMERRDYQPVVSAVGDAIDGDPMALLRFYRERCGLTDVYVADLDAIAGKPLQRAVISRLVGTSVKIWLDGGIDTAAAAREVRALGVSSVVVGTETLRDVESLAEMCASEPPNGVIVSLDLMADRLLSPIPRKPRFLEHVAMTAWQAGVRTLIALDLRAVGRQSGPPAGSAFRIKHAVPGARVLAGGGVRHTDDLLGLRAMGADGALVATALHTGAIIPSDLHQRLTR